MANVDRTVVGGGAALLFAVGLWVVATADLTSGLLPALIGFGLLALAWDPERLLRRVGVFAGSIVAMAALLFGILQFRSVSVPPTVSPEVAQQMKQLTSSSSFPDFLGSAVNFEFGFSVYYRMPVGTKLAERLPYTGVLLLLALALTAAVVGLLWLAARKLDRDGPAEVVAHLGSGLSPLVWLLGLVVFAATADVGSVSFASMDQREALSVDTLTSLVYPALALAVPTAGHILRELLAAEGDGADWSGPSLPAHSLPLSYLVGTLVVIESLYSVPGVGRLWIEGVLSRDFMLGIGAAFALTAVGLFAVLVRDAALTAIHGSVAPWAEHYRATTDGGTPLGGGGASGRGSGAGPSTRGGGLRTLRAAVRSSRRATLGAGLLGVAVVLALYSLVASPPSPTPSQALLRPPGFVDLPFALATVLYGAGIGITVAAVLGVPAGALLRGDGPVRTTIRDLLRTVTALPFLLFVFYLLPHLVQHGIVGSRSGDTAFPIAIGVALAPFVALSAADVLASPTDRSASGRAARPRPRTDGGRPDRDRDPPSAGGNPDADGPGATGPAPGGRETAETGTAGRVQQEMPGSPHPAAGSRGRAGQGTTSSPSYLPVAIPLCNAFGYAVFLVVALEWLGVTGVAGGQFGLTYALRHVGRNLVTGPMVPLAVVALAVALPVLGANLLADGLRESLRPWGSADRSVGWPRRPRLGRRPATGQAGPGPNGRRTRGRDGPGHGPESHPGQGRGAQPGRSPGGQRGDGSRRSGRRGDGTRRDGQRGDGTRRDGQRGGNTGRDGRR